MLKNITTIALFSVAFAVPLMVSKIAPYSDFSASAFAEEEKKEPKFKNAKTRKRQSVGAKCAKSLDKISVVIEEEDWAGAMEMLEKIEASSKTCKSAYEQTVLW